MPNWVSNMAVARSLGFPRTTQAGFSLFELTIVIIIVALLFAAAASHYQNNISDSQSTLLQHHAAAFKRTVDNIRAIAALKGPAPVTLDGGILVLVNTKGWPIAASSTGQPPSPQASTGGCTSLWTELFTQTESYNSENSKVLQKGAEIEFRDGRFCRYNLVFLGEGSYFFDYDLVTGKIIVSGNDLN